MSHLVVVDEVGMENGDVERGPVADLPQLLRQPRLVPGVQDPVALDHEPAANNVLLGYTVLKQ